MPERRGSTLVIRGRPISVSAAVATAGLVFYLVASLATLDQVPIVWMDEPWYTQPAWEFTQTGRFAQSMFPGLAGLDISNVAYGRIYLGAVGSVFAVLGLGVFQARLVSALAGLAVVVLTYRIGAKLWGRSAGLISAALLATSQIFVMQTHDARPEILQLALTMTALDLALRAAPERSLVWSFAAGLIAGLAADTHLNGILAVPVVGVSLAIAMGRAVWPRAAVAFAAGAAVGWTWWALLHVAPDPSLFLEQWRTVWSNPLPVATMGVTPLAPLMGELQRFFVAMFGWWELAWVIPVLAAAALPLLLLRRRDRALAIVLSALLVTIGGLTLLVANKTPRYAVAVWPFLALLVGGYMGRVPARLATVAFVGAIVLATSVSTFFIYQYETRSSYARYVEELRRVIPPGGSVAGIPTYWYGFADGPFVATHLFRAKAPFGVVLRELGVEYLLADEFFLHTQLDLEHSIDRSDVLSFLSTNAELVGVVTDSLYGNDGFTRRISYETRIYRIRPASP